MPKNHWLVLLSLALAAEAGLAFAPAACIRWASAPAAPQARRDPPPTDPPPAGSATKQTPEEKASQLALAVKLTLNADKLQLDRKYAEAEKLYRQVLEIRKTAVGEEHDLTAATLNSLGNNMRQQNQLAEAEKLHRKALEIRRKVLGEFHQNTAICYYTLAGDLRELSKFPEAEKNYRKAIEIRTQVLGPEHEATVVTMNALAAMLKSQKQYAESEKIYKKVLDMRLKAAGAKDEKLAEASMNLANSVELQGRFAEAESLYRNAVEINRKALGEEHKSTVNAILRFAAFFDRREQYAGAISLYQKALASSVKTRGSYNADAATISRLLALDFFRQGQFVQSEEMYQKTIDIQQKVFGEKNLDTSKTYLSLADCLEAQNKFSEAEDCHRKSLAILLAAHGEQHKEIVAAYGNLAVVLSRQGKFAESEKLDRKALAIALDVLGEMNSATATRYDNLAMDLHTQHRFAEAEPLFAKALTIRRKVHGEKHIHTATSYNNLASCLHAQGLFAAAEKLHRKDLEISLELNGENSLMAARAYGNVASDLRAMGRYDEAAKLNLQALDAFRASVGDKNTYTATTYHNLGFCYQSQGLFAEAEKCYRKAIEIDRQIYAKDHPSALMNYGDLAFVLYCQGDFEQSERYALIEAEGFLSARLRVSFSGLGRASFAANRSHLPFLAALLARNGKPEMAWKYLEEDLGRGLLDDLSARTTRTLSADERAQEETLQTKLASVERKISTAKKNSAQEVALVREQRDLTNKLVEFQGEMEKKYGAAAGQVYDLERIRTLLPGDTAIIGWVDAGGDVKAKIPGGEHWGVVIRREGAPAWVKLIGTGPDGVWSEKDERLPAKVRSVLQEPDPASDWSAWTGDLARQRLRPLKEHLDGINYLIVLPSYSMAGIPVEALTDRFQVSYAPSATLYAWLQENRKDFSKGPASLLALADPAFSKEQAQLALGKTAEAGSRRGGDLKPLPGTRGEVEAIGSLFAVGNARMFLGLQANGTNLDRLATQKKLSDYRFLHFATHGQFDPRGGMNSYLCLTSQNFAQAPFDKLSAGHILRTWQLDADLVTFSACLTALGQYQGGEGYVGFSQALFLSGAHSVLLSQWPVNDWSTTLLMQRFYQNLLGKREDLKGPLAKVEALGEARQWLRELSRDDAVTRLKALDIPADASKLAGDRPFEHPCYWAPFILVGDPGRRPSN
jgi:CHAT domain-containing protein/tetratricopeptide (TPR) repeat protein